MDLNKFGRRALKCAISRKKITTETPIREETLKSLHDEVAEVDAASETELAEHLHGHSEMVEELVDVGIVVITELTRRGIDIEEVFHAKMKYNEKRTD